MPPKPQSQFSPTVIVLVFIFGVLLFGVVAFFYIQTRDARDATEREFIQAQENMAKSQKQSDDAMKDMDKTTKEAHEILQKTTDDLEKQIKDLKAKPPTTASLEGTEFILPPKIDTASVNDKLQQNIQKAIQEHKLISGMTWDQAKESLGEPYSTSQFDDRGRHFIVAGWRDRPVDWSVSWSATFINNKIVNSPVETHTGD